MSCGTSLFGPNNPYIKILGGDFVAVDGANIVERLFTSDLKMPYKQIVKSRIILKSGQANYLLNHLGLGDNATFLAIKAVYNDKSVIEEDNYLEWSFYSDLTKIYHMEQLMVLTGNSTHRIKQIYLTNPNPKYSVTLDVMVAVLDDTYSFFTDSINQSGTTFTGLEYTDIKSYVIGESLVVNDKRDVPLPLIYIVLSYINSIEKTGNIITLEDSSLGSIFLQFITEFDAFQAYSLFNYVLEHPNTDIDDLGSDITPPVVYFNSTVGNTSSAYISYNGATAGVPYSTSDGLTFSTSISLSQFGTSSIIDKDKLGQLLISSVTDDRDGGIILVPSSLIISSGASSSMQSITASGTYSLSFNISDIANNFIDGVILTLTINS